MLSQEHSGVMQNGFYAWLYAALWKHQDETKDSTKYSKCVSWDMEYSLICVLNLPMNSDDQAL